VSHHSRFYARMEKGALVPALDIMRGHTYIFANGLYL